MSNPTPPPSVSAPDPRQAVHDYVAGIEDPDAWAEAVQFHDELGKLLDEKRGKLGGGTDPGSV